MGTDGTFVARMDGAEARLAKGLHIVQVKAGHAVTTHSFGVAR